MGTVRQAGEVSDADLLHFEIAELAAQVDMARQQLATVISMMYQHNNQSNAALDRVWRGSGPDDERPGLLQTRISQQ